jgi:hypothetical protein
MAALTIVEGPFIEAGESLSDGVDCSGGRLVRITTPAAWGANAPLTFQVSSDGNFFNDLYDEDGKEVQFLIGPNRAIFMRYNYWENFPFLKFRSGRSQYPITQDERRQFAVALRTD